MTNFESLIIKELKMLTDLRNLDDYENMSKQQIKSNILNISPSASKFTSKVKKSITDTKFVSKVKEKSASKTEAKGKSKPESILNLDEVNEAEQMEVEKSC